MRVPDGATPAQLDRFKGHVQGPAPMIAIDQEDELYLTLTNIGLVVRPDLDDSHTVHWHGFPNATAIFDGVPEVSISVPVGRGFPYFYEPHRAGSFMYHCHFEDVEHVQMGMNGSIFVRPTGFPNRAYADAATAFDREFAVHLNEVWTTPHDNLEAIQETVWPNYKANYWTINGRCYPDTVEPNNVAVAAGPAALVADPGQRRRDGAAALLQPRLRAAGDAAAGHPHEGRRRGRQPAPKHGGLGSVELSYETNTIYIGPGEARDTLFTAPAFNAGAALTDAAGSYNLYWLRNRSAHRLINDGYSGLGGQVTQVRVYDGALGSQTHPNETYPEFSPPNIPGTSFPYMNPWYPG